MELVTNTTMLFNFNATHVICAKFNHAHVDVQVDAKEEGGVCYGVQLSSWVFNINIKKL